MLNKVQTRRAIRKRRTSLNKDIKHLKRKAKKRNENAMRLELEHVSIGDLRRRFRSIQTPLHPALQRKIPKFKRIQSDPTQRLLVYGSDGGLLLARDHLNKPDMLKQLHTAIKNLPPTKHRKHRGADRGDYDSRHYGEWAPYSQETFIISELKDDGPAGIQFLKDQEPVFHQMSQFLGEISPRCYKEMQLYPTSEEVPWSMGAFKACVINNGGNSPDDTRIHRDVRESMYGYSCLLSIGDYTGGALVLYDLELVLELQPGDMVIFPDSLINHSNEKAEGERCSIVGFTQENVYDFWHRRYGMKLRRHERYKGPKRPKENTVQTVAE